MGVKEDIILANAVGIEDNKACERFVNEYTDLVLLKVWELSKTHCHHPNRDFICSIKIIQKQRTGSAHYIDDQCDECMDSYIWFFDFLKKKIKSFEGRNNCTLKTFVWSILNSSFTEKDWLRWKYGRAF